MPVYTNVAVSGTEVVTINSVAYVADDLNLSEGSSHVSQNDEDGVPNGQVLFPEIPTLTGTLQKATGATVRPPVQTEFTISTGDFAGTWALETVGVAAGNRAITKFSFSAKKVIS